MGRQSHLPCRGRHSSWALWQGGLQEKVVNILQRTPATTEHTLSIDVVRLEFDRETPRNNPVVGLILVKYCLDLEDPAETVSEGVG